MNRCLYCYKLLENREQDFHSSCSKKIFGQPNPPALLYSEADLDSLAREVIQSQTAVTGVQAKISLHITGNMNDQKGRRFTIVGLWGGYILKPPTAMYPHLPEVEDVTMHLAEQAKIRTTPHSLVRLASGNLAYITKRVDRTKNGKLAMEDMCQLTERLTEDKYQGSYEQIAKAIQPGLGMILSPAYDLVNTTLVNPDDDEELALTLNGKKKKIKKQDFVAAMNTMKMEEKQQENIFNKMEKVQSKWMEQIEVCFLSNEYKQQYKSLILERFNRML